MQTPLKTLVLDIETEAGSSEDSFVEKDDSQGTNPDDIVVRTTSKTT